MVDFMRLCMHHQGGQGPGVMKLSLFVVLFSWLFDSSYPLNLQTGFSGACLGMLALSGLLMPWN